MIKTIAHLADIHIKKIPTRNAEYQEVFKKLITSLKKEKPDRIVIVGDLVHDNLDLQGEQLIMAHNLLIDLSDIAPVRITRGNHDCLRKNKKRVDSVKAIVETCQGADIVYYDKTGFYEDENVTWAVWHHGEKNNNPWRKKEGKEILNANKNLLIDSEKYFTIDLFHDPITGCKSTTGFEMTSKSYYKVRDFKGNLSLLGDIHKMQYLDKEETKAYCGSLIEQDISEGDGQFHGYLLWDVEKRVSKPVRIKSNFSHHNIKVTPYTDFDDPDFEIENPTKEMKVRFVWGTLPQTRTKDNERSLVIRLQNLYDNVIISHKNEFLEEETVEINENITLENVTDEGVQQEIFKEFLEKIGADEKLIADILALDEEILDEIEIPVDDNIEWDIIKFGGTNFMSYEKLDIDWRKLDGLFQIDGENTAGKTTIMKLIAYLLFGKTPETETRIKHGDKRFVNNRNGAKSTDGYMVLEANGEYFGIKKKTTIETKRDGTITKVPTTLSYYVLANPDDEMTDDNALEKLDDERRTKTQKKLEGIVGNYDNFMRIVMTTSDTLNQNLSNDMAVFIDALLFDSGLDIFDKKLEGWKAINKRNSEKSRVVCNVEGATLRNAENRELIVGLKERIGTSENVTLPEIQGKIELGRTYLEKLTKKLHKIDDEIYNLDVDEARLDISGHQHNIVEIKARKAVLRESIDALRETYDEAKLNELIEKRDAHRQLVYDKKLEIKEEERSKVGFQHRVELLNGEILVLKRDGGKLKEEAIKLKNSKNCPECGQVIDKKEHQDHITKTVKQKEADMQGIVKQIGEKKRDIDTDWNPVIKKCDENVIRITEEIDKLNLEMETVLTDIGVLTNEKNDVERRKELQAEFDLIPTKIQNEELMIGILEQKIKNHENSLEQIENNRKIEKGITAAKERIVVLETQEEDEKEDVFIWKSKIADYQVTIADNDALMLAFKAQEYQDLVMNTYKKCVHRDGIPRQMLSQHIIPKINVTLESILSVAPFKVWLDPDDLRPKLVYYSRPDSVIDCISASGKERTFSSVVLKFALNQINVKAKPSIFLLDEVMGKLKNDSVGEFVEILQLIKLRMKKLLVVEQVHMINPDYMIQVELDEDGISSLRVE